MRSGICVVFPSSWAIKGLRGAASSFSGLKSLSAQALDALLKQMVIARANLYIGLLIAREREIMVRGTTFLEMPNLKMEIISILDKNDFHFQVAWVRI